MFRKTILSLLWIGFISYAFFFAPPASPDTLELILNLSRGNWDNINPLIIALFNIMGILPAMYGCLLFIDGRGQTIPAWPFLVGSFGLGAFALMPYLILRQPNPTFKGEKNWLLKIQDSRILGGFLFVTAIILMGFGFSQGDWGDFVNQWQTSQFIHVMSLDFCMLSLLFPTIIGDDLLRRRINQPWIFWTITLIPFFGTLIYLCVRPPLTPEFQQRELEIGVE